MIATFIAYVPAIRAGFIWDDDQHVTENILLRNAGGLRLIWTILGATPQYYPLTHTSFWIEHRLWGNHAPGYHVLNVALHVINALLLWRILALLGLESAWLAAAIFALHPIEVESVAWITERKNLLSGMFYFGSLLAYLHGMNDESNLPRTRWYLASLFLFLLAILSKTVAATLPAAILLILWWKTGRILWRHAVALLPMVLAGVVMGSITSWMERTQVGAVGPEWDFSIWDRVLIAGRALWFYAGTIVLPSKLTFIYPRWEPDASSLVQWMYPIAAVLVVGFLVLNRSRFGRGPVACVLYFIGTVFPALGFFNVYPMRYSFVADHFQYLAGIGLILLATQLLVRAVRVGQIWLIPIPIVLGILTWLQAHMYRDARTLWETTLRRNPGAWIAHDHLGSIIGTDDLESAVGHYEMAKRLNPKHVEAYVGMGNVLLTAGLTEQALEQFREGNRVRPDHPSPYFAISGTLAMVGDLTGAAEALEKILEIEPRLVQARLKLADLYTKLGRSDDAAKQRLEAQLQMRKLLGK